MMTAHAATAEARADAAFSKRPWSARLAEDLDRLNRVIPPGLRPLHAGVVERARAVAADALLLTGSTARDARTAISDLDYHLIGEREVRTDDLSREIDMHVLSAAELKQRSLAGDDFVHWSLRFGCVVFDDAGVIREALDLIAERRPWPDVRRKREQATKSLEFAARFVATGDADGAMVQVRTALTLTARAHLLDVGVFPLSRAELPAQLRDAGRPAVADALDGTIRRVPGLEELEAAVVLGEALLRP